MITSRRPADVAFRVRLGVGLLAAVAIVLMGAWVVLFSRLLEADRTIASRVREDAMWAVFQADRHAADLLYSLRAVLIQGNTALHADMLTAYDVLYSRALLLERGAFAIDLTEDTDVGQQSEARTRDVLTLAPDFDALDPSAPEYLAQLAQVEPRIAALRAGMSELVLASNQAINLGRVSERQSREAIHDRLAWSAGLLVLAFLGIGSLLVFQLRQLRRAHGRMALLQRRSRQQTLRAKAATAVKSTFLATMSHEIRTPLNAIIGSAELLGSVGLDAAQRKRVTTIHSAGQLLLDVINDILDYSKLDSQEFDLHPEVFDLPTVAHTIESTFAERAAAKGLHLQVTFEPLRIRTDARRLRQLIVNLVSNALKFTERGTVDVTSAFVEGNRLRISVRDTGIGIRKEDQSRLFRDFEQIDGSYGRAHGGTGLGLAICKRIVECMGGSIGVDSSAGAGSTFWFEIPVERIGAAETAAVAARLLPGPADDTPQTGLRVLVVEDNPINVAVISDQLRHLGHRPTVAVTGFAALDKLAADVFDLVLMDMQMPGLSGPETTRQLRATGYRLPVIAVTANASTEDRKICVAAGMNGFIAKPLTMDVLVQAIRDVVPHAPADVGSGLSDVRNSQLDDLRESFGVPWVTDLLDQFEGSLESVRADLARAAKEEETGGADAELHSFKGAALTLGLTMSGQHAQTLRASEHLTVQATDALIDIARQDIEHARTYLATASRG